MSGKPPFRNGKKKEVKAPNYKAAAAATNIVKEISFNEHDRKDFLTGFSRRKTVRREYAQKKTAEKEKREKNEQKKFAKLQREAFQQSIIDSRKKHEKEFNIVTSDNEDDDEEQEEKLDENGNKIVVPPKPKIVVASKSEISVDDKIITTTIKPLNFDSDGEEEEDKEMDEIDSDQESGEEDQDDDEDEDNEDKSKTVKKKLPYQKKEFVKFTKKTPILADGLKLVDAEKKIYTDEQGRKIRMRKEKGKLIPVVLTAAAETAIEKGWKLPRSLRGREKKSWSHAVNKKSKKKSRKEKKGK